MRLKHDEGAKELFGYESDRRRNLLICTTCLRKSFVFQLPQHQWNASSVQVISLSMQPHSARVGNNKLLSELLMIKSNIKLQSVL